MSIPPPLELTEADLADLAQAHGLAIPPWWRRSKPARPPGNSPSGSWHRLCAGVFFLLLIGGGSFAMLRWFRPVPKPYLAPVWVRDYQHRPFHSPPFSKQDQVALSEGNYFAKGRIQLKALSTCLPSDTVVLYLSARAVCNEQGQVMLLPVDADPHLPAAFRPLQTVLKGLRDTPAQQKLLILDIAWPLDDPYGGPCDLGVAAQIPRELDEVPDPHRLVLCSCAPNQVSQAASALQRSVFSYFLEEGLRGAAAWEQAQPQRSGTLTVKTLAAYVQSKVEQWTRLHSEPLQSPTLYGAADDFPLLALEQDVPPAPRERAVPAKYPEALTAAWHTRERWWTTERHRSVPWLFRQMEEALLHADRAWQDGAEAGAVVAEVHAELARLEKAAQRVMVQGNPEPFSLAQLFRDGKKVDTRALAVVKELFRKSAVERAPAAQADSHLEFADANWAAAVIAVLTSDPQPSRARVCLADRLLTQRQAHAKYAEAAYVQCLAQLAKSYEDANWPAAVVRKALLLMEQGEKRTVPASSFPWLAASLERAAQKRHDADTMLFAPGYVSLPTVDRALGEALREVETVQAQQNILEDALRQLHEAYAVLPYYSSLLDIAPQADPNWHDAVRATQALQVLLDAPSAPEARSPDSLKTLVAEVRLKTEHLRSHLLPLAELHSPLVVEDFITRSYGPDAAAQTYRALSVQGLLPFHAPELRAKIWEARAALGAKIAARILDAEGIPPSESAPSQDAYTLAVARSARALALLRLAGLDGAPRERLEGQWQAFAQVKAAAQASPLEVRQGYVLSTSLRQTWVQLCRQQTSTSTDLLWGERISRVAPGWIRPGANEERLMKAAFFQQASQERARWTWLADRAHYESHEPNASPFTAHTAFILKEFMQRPTSGLSLPTASTQVTWTRQNPSQRISIPLHWQQRTKENADVICRVIDPHEEWLHVEPEFAPLDRVAALPLGKPAQIELPVHIQLKTSIPPKATPPPAGILLGFTSQGRTYRHLVHLPALPAADRLEILVSADPKQPSNPLGDLRLRPGLDRQPFYLYVNNLSGQPRALIAELRTHRTANPAGKVVLTAPPKQSTRLQFGTSMPLSDATSTSSATSAMTELTAPLEIRLYDRDHPQEVLASREIRVELAHPREYVRVASIRFEPAGEANHGKNRLEVALQSVQTWPGAPCQAELKIPLERNTGLKAVRHGTFRGTVPADPAKALKLFAGDWDFERFGDDPGEVYLAVDGIERAFAFRVPFAPIGPATTPQADTRLGLRLQAARYYRTNTKFETAVEIDNAPEAARLQVSLGRRSDDQSFEAEIRHPLLPPQQKRIRLALNPRDGGLEFDTLLRDWRIPFEAVLVRGERVVEARLLDPQGNDLLPPVYHRVHFDDQPPEQVAFLNLPKQGRRDAAYLLKATGADVGTGLSEVAFFLAHPDNDGAFPPSVRKFDAQLSATEANVWSALIHWPADRKGPVNVSARFTNKLGLSAIAQGTVELVDEDTETRAVGALEGVVREGSRSQPGVLVVLWDEQGHRLAEQTTHADGNFTFPNLPPGHYVITVSKPTSSRPVTARTRVTVAPGKTERVQLDLFL